ncbi:MAG: hypothetical protein WD712_03020 [Candidatus Spechtbacterales bacterium]
MDEQHHKKVRYVCEGTCGANLTEEEYQNHPTKVCGTEGCTNKGHEFARKEANEGHEKDAVCEHCDNCAMCKA